MAAYYNKDTVIYRDGRLVKASEASTDLYGQSLHYGYAVFEGIRSYRTGSGETRIFKAQEHYDRLARSARALHMPYNWTSAELIEASYEVLKQNGQQNAYIRPLVYGPANMSFNRNEESFIAIETWEMSPFLGNKALKVGTSSYQRPNPKAFHIEAKASGHYVNSILASQEVKSNGFDEALLTDMNGFVAEGPGANLFIEKDGKLLTPATGHILPGITRQTVLELCTSLGIEVSEQTITLEDIKNADAAFFCGTAAEIVGWAGLDEHRFDIPWEQTISFFIQQAYNLLVRDEDLAEIHRQVQVYQSIGV